MEKCTKCKKIKERKKFRKRKGTKNGLQYWCRDCENEANRKRYTPKQKKTKKPKHSEQIKRDARNRMLKHRYGITIDQYETMYFRQEGKCQICKEHKPPKGQDGLYVDHCHETEKVRGLLCASCNSSIGKFKENIKILENAIDYIKRYRI